jgi:hypothetical protein
MRAVKDTIDWITENSSNRNITFLAAFTTGATWHGICALNQLRTSAFYKALPVALLLPFGIVFCVAIATPRSLKVLTRWIESFFWHIGTLLIAFVGALYWRVQIGSDDYPWPLFIVMFCGLSTLVGILILVFAALWHANEAFLLAKGMVARPQKSKQPLDSPAGLERLHPVVLLLGIAAGTAVGVLVGIEGMRRLYLDSPHPTLYQRMTESFATGAVSGTLIAVFVAVGCVVFVFERKMSHFDRNAYNLLDQLEGITVTVQELELEVSRRAGDLVNILHTNMGIEELRYKVQPDVVSSEAWYLSAWFRQIGMLPAGSPRLEAACAIARSYWCEEAFDISRWQLVTNSRNYAAFLISVVDRLVATSPDRKIYFYTSTPVAPFFLLNMPLQIRTNLSLHGRQRFLDEYMSFVRDVISDNDNVVHERFIWSVPFAKDVADLPVSFRGWFHYPFGGRYGMTDRQGWKILGVPLSVSRILANADLFDLRSLYCDKGNCGGELPRQNDDLGEFIAALEATGESLRAFPLVNPNSHDDTTLQTVIRKELEELRIELRESFDNIKRELTIGSAALSKALKGDRSGKTWQTLVDNIQNICTGNWEMLPAAHHIIASLQALGAVAAATNESPLDALPILEDRLLRAKWWQKWMVQYPTATIESLPRFKDFFDSTFHSGVQQFRAPRFVPAKALAMPNGVSSASEAVRKAFEDIGPEFAMVGVGSERKEAGVGPITWVVALQSTINQPWTSGEIKVVFSNGRGFEKYQTAIDYLIDQGRTEAT